jgi:hypothetical protein
MQGLAPFPWVCVRQAGRGGRIRRLGEKLRLGRQPGMNLDPQQILVPGSGIAPQQLIQGARLLFPGCAMTHRGHGVVKLGRRED